MSLRNFLPLRREVREHWVYKDNDYFKLWVEILFCARFSEESTKEIHKGKIYILNQGEFLFSRRTWSNRLNIGEGKVRTCVDLLISDGMIEKVGSVGKRGASIYSVTNYKLYNKSPETQPTEQPTEQPTHNPPTSAVSEGLKGVSTHTQPTEQPTHNPPTSRKEEGKSVKTKYNTIFEHYLTKDNLIKHKTLTQDIEKGIDKAMKELSLTVDDCIKIIDRHSDKVRSTKSNGKYAVRKRGLAVLFGQKKQGSVVLICTDYLEENYVEEKETIRDKPTKGESITL